MSRDHLLQEGSWYGMTMWPGYTGTPYRSPIRILRLIMHENEVPDDLIDMDFYNAAYAHGVRTMDYTFHVLIHQPTYLLATLMENRDRALAIEPLTSDWIQTFFPDEFAKLQDIAGHGGMSLEDGIPLLAADW
ncbi:hypothetical protein [Aquisediminimonas profunda]|uniref:hypothetical protein n=1 Tax=Aquisediminimonas profunda TaxID=1550733 RepID=UPI001C629E1C|nr:hypothetical protein [Aquisediminimonas profunda]